LKNCVVLDLVVHIPVVSLNDDGRMVMVSEELEGEKLDKEPVDKEKRKLLLKSIPFSLTCILHRNYILPYFRRRVHNGNVHDYGFEFIWSTCLSL